MGARWKVAITRDGGMYHWEAACPPDYWTSYTGAALTKWGARWAVRRVTSPRRHRVVAEYEV